jgi:release factor glutamine methyltransferase
MTLKKLKKICIDQLSTQYPIEEIESFYFILLEDRLNLKRVDIALNPNLNILPEDWTYFNNCISKLYKEIPIQYIIGNTEFYGLPFKVTPDTLIPRPETEELVQWILNYTSFDATQHPKKNKQINILDIGTGSGCIAISLAKNLPNSNVTAYDVSEEALKVAKQNAILNEVTVTFDKIDILKTDFLKNKFDIIVSNPPYVRNLEKKEINKNVLGNEPHLALFVKNNNPLLFYDKIADLAKNNLKPGGQLFFEINQYLGIETVELLNKKGYSKIELRKDIFRNDRVIMASL